MTIMVQSTRTVRRWWVLKIRKMWNHNLYIIILGNPLQRMVGSKTPQTASTTSTVVSSQKTEEKNKEKSCLYDCFRPAPWWQLAACVRYTIIYIYMSVFAYACSVHMCYTCACLRVSWQASQTTRPDHYRPQTSSMSSSRLSSSSWSSWSSACAAAVHVSGHRTSSVHCRTGRDTSDRMEDGNEKINTSCVSLITEPLASLILAHFLLLLVKSQTVPLATCNHLPWSFNLIHLKHVFIITSITYVFLQFFNHWNLTLYLYS